MDEYLCEQCNLEFEIDILNPEYHLYNISYCPNCGSPIEEEYYDEY